MNKKIIIFHSHAHENYGDVLMLRGVCKWIKKYNPQIDIHILSMEGMKLEFEDCYDYHWHINGYPMPYRTGTAARYFHKLTLNKLSGPLLHYKTKRVIYSKRHESLLACEKTNEDISLYHLFKSADGILFTGNGYLNDNFPYHVMLAYELSKLAGEMSIPSIATGQGLGPLRDKTLRRFVKQHLIHCTRAWTRDPLSSDLAKREMQLSIPCIGDDALLALSECPSDMKISSKRVLMNHRLRCGIRKEQANDSILEMVSILAKRGINHITCVIMQSDEESNWKALQSKISGDITLDYFRPLQDDAALESVLTSSYIGIGISYHFCLLCAHYGLAVIGLYESEYYLNKLTGISRLYPETPVKVGTYQENAVDIETWLSQVTPEKRRRNVEAEDRVRRTFQDTFAHMGIYRS